MPENRWTDTGAWKEIDVTSLMSGFQYAGSLMGW